MNICVDCVSCRIIDGWKYLCFREDDSNGIDCRKRNHDGKCSAYERKKKEVLHAMPTPEEILDSIPSASAEAHSAAIAPIAHAQATAEGRLFELAMKRAELKEAVAEAQAALDANTEAIAELIPGPEAGQKTKQISDYWKVTVRRELIYKPDANAMRDFCAANTIDGNPIFAPLKVKTSEELDEKGYKWYQKNHPQVFAQLAGFVSAKPAKVAVELKPVKKK